MYKMAFVTKLYLLLVVISLARAGIRGVSKRMIKDHGAQDIIPTSDSDMDYKQYEEIVKRGLPKTLDPQHVIIVGGGIAGLVAGKLLSEANHKVTILEAQPTCGGRIDTYRIPDTQSYAELGAMRIPDTHILVNAFIKKFNLEIIPFKMNDPNTFYYINKQREKTFVVDQNPNIFNFGVAKNESGKSADELWQFALEPLFKELKENGWEYILEKYDTYSILGYLQQSHLSREAIQMIGLLNNHESLFQTALLENIRDSVNINDLTKFFEIVGGMDKLVQPFVDALKGSITLGAKVTKVQQKADKVIVTYDKTGTSDPTLEGDAVLLTTTAPATSFIDFDPILSLEKRTALRAIHYDSATKIYLWFTRAFWLDYNIHGGKSITDLNSRFTYYPSHNVSSGYAVILASYTWGEDAEKWAAMKDEDCINYALKMLEKIHGNKGTLSQIYRGGIVKKWSQDEYSLGAFAMFNPSQEMYFSEAIAAVEGRIYFAGEHTTLNHGWIEGSIASGVRAAVEISTEQFDIVVIGGGPMGLAAAYYAAKEGKKVAVIERYSFQNQLGSSAGQSRQFREMYDKEYLSTFVKNSVTMWQDLEKESGKKLLYQNGYLFMGNKGSGQTTEGDFEGISNVCKSLNLGCEELSSSDVENLFPFSDLPDKWEGLYHKTSGQIDANATITALLKLLRGLSNVALYDNTKVVDINNTLSYVKAGLIKVKTSRNLLKTERLIVAPGPYANQVFKLLNFSIEMKIWELPTFYYKVLKQGAKYPTWFAFGGDNQSLFYGFPENEWDNPGYVKVCPLFVQKELDDPSEAERNDTFDDSLKKTTAFVHRHLPYVDSKDVITKGPTCLSTSVVDDGFVLDFAPPSVPNNERIIVFAAGWGFKFVPIFGRIMAQLAIKGRTDYKISEMAITRPGILTDTPIPTQLPPKKTFNSLEIGLIVFDVVAGGILIVVVVGCVVRRWRRRRFGEEQQLINPATA